MSFSPHISPALLLWFQMHPHLLRYARLRALNLQAPLQPRDGGS